jgi:hypothetical protein
VGVGVGVGVDLGVGVGVDLGVGVWAGVGLDVGVAVDGLGVDGTALEAVGETVGNEGVADAFAAVVPPPGATVAWGVLNSSKNPKTASAPATTAIRNTLKALPSTS